MTVAQAGNRGMNMLMAALMGVFGLGFGLDVFGEDELTHKLDDGLVLIVAAAVVAWYFVGRNRFQRTWWPIGAFVVILAAKAVAAFALEASDQQDVGDDHGAVTVLPLVVIMLGLIYWRTPKAASNLTVPGILARSNNMFFAVLFGVFAAAFGLILLTNAEHQVSHDLDEALIAIGGIAGVAWYFWGDNRLRLSLVPMAFIGAMLAVKLIGIAIERSDATDVGDDTGLAIVFVPMLAVVYLMNLRAQRLIAGHMRALTAVSASEESPKVPANR